MGLCQCVERKQVESEQQLIYNSQQLIKQNEDLFESQYVRLSQKPLNTNLTLVRNSESIKLLKVQKRQLSQIRVAKFVPITLLGTTQTFKNVLQKTPQIDHSCVLKFYEYFIEEKNFILIYEFCEGKSLDCLQKNKKFKNYFNNSDIFNISRQLLSICCQLEENKYIHQALNPSSILFRFDTKSKIACKTLIKIPILSIEKSITTQEQKQYFNLKYASPEQILGQPLNEKSDIFSIGLILAEIMLKSYPFNAKTPEDFVILYSVDFNFQDQIGSKLQNLEMPVEFINLIQNMLMIKVEQRCSAKQAQEMNLLYRREQQSLSFQEVTIMINSIKKLVLNYMANTYATQQRKAEFEIIFNKIDVDLSGAVNYQEVTQAFKQACKGKYTDQQIDSIIKQFFINADTSGDGTLSFSELFTAAICVEMQYDESIIEQAFKFFDQNGSGTIEIEEFAKNLECTQNTKLALEKVLREADRNKNGSIDYNEFKISIKE